MEILVDTSVYIAVCLNEASKPRVLELTSRATLVSPKSVHGEVGNASTGMIKKGRLSLLLAKASIAFYKRISVRFVYIELGATLQLAYPHRMWIYDAYIL
jgi:predicted nucleic acid-binding protein